MIYKHYKHQNLSKNMKIDDFKEFKKSKKTQKVDFSCFSVFFEISRFLMIFDDFAFQGVENLFETPFKFGSPLLWPGNRFFMKIARGKAPVFCPKNPR